LVCDGFDDGAIHLSVGMAVATVVCHTTRACVIDGNSHIASFPPSRAPRVSEDPVVKACSGIASVANNSDCVVNIDIASSTADDATCIVLKHGVSCRQSDSHRRNLELSLHFSGRLVWLVQNTIPNNTRASDASLGLALVLACTFLCDVRIIGLKDSSISFHQVFNDMVFPATSATGRSSDAINAHLLRKVL